MLHYCIYCTFKGTFYTYLYHIGYHYYKNIQKVNKNEGFKIAVAGLFDQIPIFS